jgi:zinc protease
VFEGVAVRALVNTHTPDPQLVTKVTAALAGRRRRPTARSASALNVSFDAASEARRAGQGR